MKGTVHTHASAIFEALREAGRPLSIKEIEKEVDGWATRSTYLTLRDMCFEGLVVKTTPQKWAKNVRYSLPPIAWNPREMPAFKRRR